MTMRKNSGIPNLVWKGMALTNLSYESARHGMICVGFRRRRSARQATSCA